MKTNKLLEGRISRLSRIFNIEKVLSVSTGISSIARYYKINKLTYSLFHSGRDFVHMGLSVDGIPNRSDVLAQAHIIEKYLKNKKAKHILELATGRGATSAYLAKRNSNAIFDAVDLPDGQVDIAIKKAEVLKNMNAFEGDYHDLSMFSSSFYDLVFIIEALCYSSNKTKVFSEINRVLKKGGLFVVFDGYCAKPKFELSESESMAMRLMEKGMVVEEFEYYGEVRNKLLRSGFKKIYEEDASQKIIPSLKRFERYANLLISLPNQLARMIVAVFPEEFVNNAISGYLLKTLIEQKIASYTILVVEKK